MGKYCKCKLDNKFSFLNHEKLIQTNHYNKALKCSQWYIWLARGLAEEVTSAPRTAFVRDPCLLGGYCEGFTSALPSRSRQECTGTVGSVSLWQSRALESASYTQQDINKYLTNERMVWQLRISALQGTAQALHTQNYLHLPWLAPLSLCALSCAILYTGNIHPLPPLANHYSTATLSSKPASWLLSSTPTYLAHDPLTARFTDPKDLSILLTSLSFLGVQLHLIYRV